MLYFIGDIDTLTIKYKPIKKEDLIMEYKTDVRRSLEKKSFLPLTCVQLLQKFEKKEMLLTGEKLRFSGVGVKDVYNISKPFLIGGETIIAGRVESRETSTDSEIIFFKDNKNEWAPVYGAPTFKLEDSFSTKIGDETIFGGVETYQNSTGGSQDIDYQTVFYRGRTLASLKKFAAGPEMMKDIRLTLLANRKIGVFTRPQGGNNDKGKIGYVEVNQLKDINPKNLLKAKIIENQFASGEWGGSNDLSLLKNGHILVWGHVAYEDTESAKHYYVMTFEYNPKMHRALPLKIIATRKNFPAGAKKTAKHEDITFLGGSVCHLDKTATLYMGLSDAEAGCFKLQPVKSLKKIAGLQ